MRFNATRAPPLHLLKQSKSLHTYPVWSRHLCLLGLPNTTLAIITNPQPPPQLFRRDSYVQPRKTCRVMFISLFTHDTDRHEPSPVQKTTECLNGTLGRSTTKPAFTSRKRNAALHREFTWIRVLFHSLAIPDGKQQNNPKLAPIRSLA